jgi:hypothetical protein
MAALVVMQKSMFFELGRILKGAVDEAEGRAV